MTKEHYLAAVSTAIENMEGALSDEYEKFAQRLNALDTSDTESIDYVRRHFDMRVAGILSRCSDAIGNLNKWPLR